MSTTTSTVDDANLSSGDPMTRHTRVMDSIRAKLTQLPKVDHNGYPIDPQPGTPKRTGDAR